MPNLVIGARYDTMDPAHMEKMAHALPHGEYLYCPRGSHMAMYDDQATYFAGPLGLPPSRGVNAEPERRPIVTAMHRSVAYRQTGIEGVKPCISRPSPPPAC